MSEEGKIWAFLMILVSTLLCACFKKNWPKDLVFFTGAISTMMVGIIPAKALAASIVNCIVFNLFLFFIFDAALKKNIPFKPILIVLFSVLGAYLFGTTLTLILMAAAALLFLFRLLHWREAFSKLRGELILLVVSALVFQKGFTEIHFSEYCKQKFTISKKTFTTELTEW